MHCSRVFRSSVPSELVPSSPNGRGARGEYGSTRSKEWGVGSGGAMSHRGCCPAVRTPGHIPEDTSPGPVHFQGRVARCVIQNWSHVLSAATRLESAWEQWRAARTRGRARAAGRKLRRLLAQRALGEPRVVIGIDADEAEYLAEFLDRDECLQRGQVSVQQALRQQVPLQQVPLQGGPLQSGPLQQVRLTEPVFEGTGEYPNPVHLNAPPAPDWGRPSPDQARDIAAEVAGWTPGEPPGQPPEQLASWPPGADQPPAGA